MRTTVRYSWFCGGLDLKGDSYRILRRGSRDGFHIYAGDGKTEVLYLNPDSGMTREKTAFREISEIAAGISETSSLAVEFESESAMRTRIEFFPDRIEVSASGHYASGINPPEVFLCRGSRINGDLLFSPIVEGCGSRFYTRPDEPRILEPGLASPPPFCYALRYAPEQWMGFSLEPELKNLDFIGFNTHPETDGSLSWGVAYRDLRLPTTELSPPPLVFRFGNADEFATIGAHVRGVTETGKLPLPKRSLPAWHHGLLLCGWRAQTKVPRREDCTQKVYEDLVVRMEEKNLSFDTLIIDDYWGREHGIWKADLAKWPDMRGFIDAQHRKGRRVLLWVCTDAEGLPENERIGSLHRLESPALQARLREDAHRMLSSDDGCYNADGIKFDFTSSVPVAQDGMNFFGIGYMRERFRMVSEACRAVRPDCLLDFQCCNPYFSELQTMIRLNDYMGIPEHGLPEMEIRAKIARAVALGALIDTDHISYGVYSYRGGFDFFRKIGAYGCDSWYLAPADLDDENLVKVLRKVGAKYRSKKQQNRKG